MSWISGFGGRELRCSSVSGFHTRVLGSGLRGHLGSVIKDQSLRSEIKVRF